MTEKIEAYPLHWPVGWPRCQSPTYSRFETTIAKAREGLMRELDLLGARNVVISSNAVLLKSGEIAGRQPRLEDTGVAVYFTLDNQQRCIPCDRWVLLEENIQAVRKAVEALRGIDRWGTPGIVAAAFQGFQALPSGKSVPWWRVLEVEPTASDVEIERAYRELARRHHPDASGDPERFREINAAYRVAKGKGDGLMTVSDRALIDAETLPLRQELYRLEVEQAVTDDWLQRLAVRTADIRARRKAIDGELVAITSRINEGRALRQRMGRR